MKFARAMQNYNHRGLTKVRDALNLYPLFDLVQPGWCFPYAYGYDERTEAQLAVLSRYGIVDLLDTAPAKAAIAPQYFDERVIETLPDEFKAAYLEPRKTRTIESSEDQE